MNSTKETDWGEGRAKGKIDEDVTDGQFWTDRIQRISNTHVSSSLREDVSNQFYSCRSILLTPVIFN